MNIYYKASFSIIAMLFVSSVTAVELTSIEACSKLLPDGHEYSFTIETTIDKTKSNSEFTGNISLSGGTDDVSNFDIKEFIECISPLIKKQN